MVNVFAFFCIKCYRYGDLLKSEVRYDYISACHRDQAPHSTPPTDKISKIGVEEFPSVLKALIIALSSPTSEAIGVQF